MSPSAIARTIGPYAVAILALGWVLHKTDIHKLAADLRHAPIAAFVAVSALMLVINCGADTFAMTTVFARFGRRIRYWDLYMVRASTYLLAVVNYHVGQAAILGYLYRVQRVPLLRASGWILFIIGINVGTLFLLASAGAANAHGQLAALRWIPLVCVLGVGLYALILWRKPRVLAERALLQPLFEAGIGGHIVGVLVRLPHIGVLLVWHFVSLRMFGVEVPASAALLYLPAYFAVQSLPINVNGLGVAQAVAIYFFAPYVHVPAGVVDPAATQKAAVMAYSLSTSGISIVLQLLLGLACLKRATALGLKAAPVDSASDPEPEGKLQMLS